MSYKVLFSKLAEKEVKKYHYKFKRIYSRFESD